MNFFFAILLWTFFGIIHSIMARPVFKYWLIKKLNNTFEQHFYRLIYFISQCILFFFIYGLIKNLDYGSIIYTLPNKFHQVYYILYILSNLFLILSVLQFDISEFIGVKQFINFFINKKKNKHQIEKLNTNFLYRYLRHPMYFGIILVYIFSHTIFTELFLINLGCILLYIEIGSYYEEKSLIKKFGKEYLLYKSKTYKYIPFLR
jgi:protein-S-isoprenylcysteine O-methyltransferase Ste14